MSCKSTTLLRHKKTTQLVYISRYHHLNHFALFGGGYRSGAMSIMKRLLSKYGTR